MHTQTKLAIAGFCSSVLLAWGCAAPQQQPVDLYAADWEIMDLNSDRTILVHEGPRGVLGYSIIAPDGRIVRPRTPADEVLAFDPDILIDLDHSIEQQVRFPLHNRQPLLPR